MVIFKNPFKPNQRGYQLWETWAQGMWLGEDVGPEPRPGEIAPVDVSRKQKPTHAGRTVYKEPKLTPHSYSEKRSPARDALSDDDDVEDTKNSLNRD